MPTVIGIIFEKNIRNVAVRRVAVPTLSKSSVDFQDSRVIPPQSPTNFGPFGVASCTGFNGLREVLRMLRFEYGDIHE